MADTEEISDLATLVGPHELSGADEAIITEPNLWGHDESCEVLSFVLDGIVYRAVEDPSDGYRSGLKRLERGGDLTVTNRFAPVNVVASHRTKNRNDYGGKDDVLELRDVINGELVLEVGTANIDDYYPSFIGWFYPQAMSTRRESAPLDPRSPSC